jgi:hypothetical protein
MPTPLNPPSARHLTREMAFPKCLGACGEWDDSDRRYATAVVKAHLLEPTDGVRRVQVQQILLAAEIDQIEPLSEFQSAQKLKARDLRTRLSLDISMLAQRSASTLERALAFDVDKPVRGKSKGKKTKGKHYGPAARYVITAGLVAVVMHSRGCTPSAAKALIYEYGSTNEMFFHTSKEVNKAWRDYQSVAHVAAAFLQYVCAHDLTRFRGKQRKEMRSNIVELLNSAAFYQTFLQDTLPALKPRRLRTKFDLVQLPPWLKLTPSEPAPLKDIATFMERGSSTRRKKAS